MSGGRLYDFTWPDFEAADGRWMDEELNELYRDLFTGGEFSARGYGGLSQSLDYWLSGDTGEADYREALARFKAKWFGRTDADRAAFYAARLQADCDRYKAELGLTEWKGEE